MAKQVWVIVGGGAAGFFAAIHAAEQNPEAEVLLLEKGRDPLAKVALTGGGRCNVTHACFDPARLTTFYPRGAKELLGVFHRWQPQDTVDWFTSEGVALKTEGDGRIFPASDKSADIVHALRQAAERSGVRLRLSTALESARALPEGGFELSLQRGETLRCDALMLATGGNIASRGFALAASLGHTVEPLTPSLFTFHTNDPRLSGLQGLSMPSAQIAIEDDTLKATGPLLITHTGLSGPAVLRLSAWGARHLASLNYRFTLRVRWAHDATPERARELWKGRRREQGRKSVRLAPMEPMAQRLWAALVRAADIPDDRTWSGLSRDEEARLLEQWTDARFSITGKSLFKEEFVTCGGVRLSEVNFKTMESRICPRLYFGGELLDIDGLTGGFNLQVAWSTGYLAGCAMGELDDHTR